MLLSVAAYILIVQQPLKILTVPLGMMTLPVTTVQTSCAALSGTMSLMVREATILSTAAQAMIQSMAALAMIQLMQVMVTISSTAVTETISSMPVTVMKILFTLAQEMTRLTAVWAMKIP